MRGHEKPAAWFSFNRSEAETFARLAWTEDNRLPTLCRVLISGRTEELFDADSDLDDPETEANFVACLLSKSVSEYWIESILSDMRNYEFTAFDPEGGGTSSHLVAECIQEMGYIGWKERESHLDDPQNFGLFDPGMRVQVLEVIKSCPECERDLDKSEEDAHTFECGSCEAIWRECDQCGELLEYDEEDDEWVYSCHCDFRDNPMQSFNHDIYYGDYDTHPYLHNPILGGTTFYHVSKGEGCKFDKAMLSFFGLTKGYVQEFFGIHSSQAHIDWAEDDSRPEELTVCEVRFRNLKWDNIFDVAQYIDSLDTSEYVDGDMLSPVRLTKEGEDIKARTGFPIEGYYFRNFLNYRKSTGRQLIADLNRLGYGPFYGFLEDEDIYKQPPCDEDDDDCIVDLTAGDERLTDSESPLSLALDFRLGRDIVVEVVRYEVVDSKGRKIYSVEDDSPIEFRPGRQNPSEICTNRFRDLKEEFDPSIHTLKYNLSASVANGIGSYLQRGFYVQQRMVKDKIKRYGLEGRLPLNSSLRDFGSALQEYIEFHTESLEDLERIGRLMSEDTLFWHFVPPYFGYSDITILDTPFWFVHFTSKDSALSIEQDGFLGREDTDALYSTRHGTQSDAGRDGYIFGYLLQAATQKEALKEVYRNFQTYEQDYEDDESRPFPYYVVSPHYIVAKADFGVEAFHKMDNERQAIIPTKCVDNESIAVATDVLEEFGVEWWDDE